MPDQPQPATQVHPRKLEIVDAAIACFLRQGYHQTGMRDIAREAGVSIGNLYNHFKGKEALLAFIGALESAELAPFIDGLTSPPSPRQRLLTFIDTYGAYAARPENALLGVELLAEALRTPKIAAVFEQNRASLSAALETCLQQGAQSGDWSLPAPPAEVATMVLDMIESHGLRQNLGARAQSDASGLRRFILAALAG